MAVPDAIADVQAEEYSPANHVRVYFPETWIFWNETTDRCSSNLFLNIKLYCFFINPFQVFFDFCDKLHYLFII